MATRTKDDAVSYSSDIIVLSLVRSGVMRVAQDGREARLLKGDLAIHDLGRPYSLSFDTDFSQYIFQIPRQLLRNRLGPIEPFTARTLSRCAELQEMSSGFFLGLAQIDNDLRQNIHSRLVDQAIELLAVALEIQLGVEQCGTSPHRTALLYRAKSFVESHLSEAVTAVEIAQYLGCSRRYVSSLFADEDMSVGRYILTRRLQHCRAELEGISTRRISDIAYAWGFNSTAHFSRAFRDQFGFSPTDCREGTTQA